MPQSLPPDLPAHDQYADMLDADDWNRDEQGSFADHATDGDEIEIIRYEFPEEVKPDADDDTTAE